MTTYGAGRTGPALPLLRDDSRPGVAATASQVRSHPHTHDVVVIVMGKLGERWRVCRTCGERLA